MQFVNVTAKLATRTTLPLGQKIVEGITPELILILWWQLNFHSGVLNTLTKPCLTTDLLLKWYDYRLIPCGVNNLMRTYYTHRLTQRSHCVWLEVGRIVTEWLPKQGLYYRDPRISDTRRPVLPPGRAESGSWPIAQIAIISSITCSTDSHLGAFIVEPWLYCRDLGCCEI